LARWAATDPGEVAKRIYRARAQARCARAIRRYWRHRRCFKASALAYGSACRGPGHGPSAPVGGYGVAENVPLGRAVDHFSAMAGSFDGRQSARFCAGGPLGLALGTDAHSELTRRAIIGWPGEPSCDASGVYAGAAAGLRRSDCQTALTTHISGRLISSCFDLRPWPTGRTGPIHVTYLSLPPPDECESKRRRRSPALSTRRRRWRRTVVLAGIQTGCEVCG